MRKVLDRAHKVRLRLNSEKCKFLLKEVSYVGHVFTEQGLKPDPPKVQAIADIPPPEDKAALQRFLGMMNYLGRFIPNHSNITAPVHQLLHMDIAWCWSEQHQKAFDTLKQCVISPPVLSYYDVHKPVTLT